MNTLMPEQTFPASARVLDTVRLGKQRADVITILKACQEPPPKDGSEHPSIKMWRGNELSLIQYGTAVCVEWMGRGNPDNTLKKILAFKDFFLEEPIGDGANVVRAAMPEWMGNAALHDAHKSFLLRAKPSWYRQFWPKLNDELAMVWPRSPEKQRTTSDERQKEKLVARAIRLKERADAARTDAHDAAIKAGLDPNTMKPKLDPELAALK